MSTSQAAVLFCWERNHRSGIALAMFCGISTGGLNGLIGGDHPAYTPPLRIASFTFTLGHMSFCVTERIAKIVKCWHLLTIVTEMEAAD